MKEIKEIKSLDNLLVRYQEDLQVYQSIMASNDENSDDYIYYEGASSALEVAIELLKNVISLQKNVD